MFRKLFFVAISALLIESLQATKGNNLKLRRKETTIIATATTQLINATTSFTKHFDDDGAASLMNANGSFTNIPSKTKAKRQLCTL